MVNVVFYVTEYVEYIWSTRMNELILISRAHFSSQGSKNMTIKGQSATVHFHIDQTDNKAQTFMFNTSKKLKGFWFYFTGTNIQIF